MAKKSKADKTNARQAFEVNIQCAPYFLDVHETAQKGAGARLCPGSRCTPQ